MYFCSSILISTSEKIGPIKLPLDEALYTISVIKYYLLFSVQWHPFYVGLYQELLPSDKCAEAYVSAAILFLNRFFLKLYVCSTSYSNAQILASFILSIRNPILPCHSTSCRNRLIYTNICFLVLFYLLCHLLKVFYILYQPYANSYLFPLLFLWLVLHLA